MCCVCVVKRLIIIIPKPNISFFNPFIFCGTNTKRNRIYIKQLAKEIIANNNFSIVYEPILSTEKISILGFNIHSKFTSR